MTSTPPYAQQPGSAPEPKAGRGVSPRLIGAAVLLVLALIFVFENTRKVKVRFLVPEVKAPLWLALVITLVLGMLVGFFLARHRSNKKS
jgi:uncharacterized integral membrane protein